MRLGQVPSTGRASNPVVITDAAWYRLADDLAVAMAASPRGLFWVTAERGAGKTAWLQALMPALRTDYFLLDLRDQASTAEVLEQSREYSNYRQGTLPALILDNLSPADLMALLAEPEHPARHLVSNYDGPLLLLSPEQEDDAVAVRRMERVMGRSLVHHDLPPSSRSQNQAVLVAHRPVIEARWDVRITDAAMGLTVSGLHYRSSPGQVVEWLERTAARVAVSAEAGPAECRQLRAELDTLDQRIEANQQTGEPLEELQQAYEQASLHLTAAEVDWLERQASGTLRQVFPEDVRNELESLTGSSDHPDLHIPSDVAGGSRRAGSGNLRS